MGDSTITKPSQYTIFLSYSRKDSGLVSKVSLILRAAGNLPWLDEQSIEPGDRWRTTITRSIERCERMLVFWCRHAKLSSEVRSEYLSAIDKNKPVVPVRLDRTKLAPKLGPYQGIDVSKLMWWSHEVARWERLPWMIGFGLLALGSAYALL